MRCTDAHASSLAQPEIAEFSAADTHRIFQHSFKYRLQLAGRTADHFQNVGGRCLLLQRFAELVQQARVLDGDDRLGGEGLDERYLFVAEYFRLKVRYTDCADDPVVANHWSENGRTEAKLAR